MLAIGLAGWQWLETRAKLADTQQELARRLAESDSANAESRALARQAQAQN
jgi:uroporphyrin-3 C-methyltransferase